LALAQWEGGNLYFTSTSAAIFVKGAGAASGGMTLLSTTTLSGTLTTVSSISASYTNLFILVRGVVNGTAQDAFQFKFNTSSTNIHGISNKNTNGTAGTDVFTNANINTGGTFPLNTGGLNVFAFTIPNYANTSYYKNWSYSFGFETFTQKSSGHGGGQIATTSAISSFSIETTNAYTFSAGQILVYGVN
jgi:hypothetical protein